MNKTFALATLALLLVPAISFAKTPNTDIPTLLKELAQLEAELAALEAPTTTPVSGAVIWPTPIATSTPVVTTSKPVPESVRHWVPNTSHTCWYNVTPQGTLESGSSYTCGG